MKGHTHSLWDLQPGTPDQRTVACKSINPSCCISYIIQIPHLGRQVRRAMLMMTTIMMIKLEKNNFLKFNVTILNTACYAGVRELQVPAGGHAAAAAGSCHCPGD